MVAVGGPGCGYQFRNLHFALIFDIRTTGMKDAARRGEYGRWHFLSIIVIKSQLLILPLPTQIVPFFGIFFCEAVLSNLKPVVKTGFFYCCKFGDYLCMCLRRIERFFICTKTFLRCTLIKGGYHSCFHRCG